MWFHLNKVQAYRGLYGFAMVVFGYDKRAVGKVIGPDYGEWYHQVIIGSLKVSTEGNAGTF